MSQSLLSSGRLTLTTRFNDTMDRVQVLRSPLAQQVSLVVSDIFTLTVSFSIAVGVLRYTDPHTLTGVEAIATMLIGVVWMIALRLTGTYALQHVRAGATEYKRAINATWIAGGTTGIMCYLLSYGYPRLFFGTWMLVGVALLCVFRWVRRRMMQRLHRRGLLLTQVIIAGDVQRVDEIATVLDREKWTGYQVRGAVTHNTEGSTSSGIPVLGSFAELPKVLESTDVHVVVFTEGTFGSSGEFRRFAWQLEQSQIQIVLAPTLADISAERLECRPVAGLPLLHVGPPTALRSLRGLKRTMDIVGAALALVLTGPILLAAMLAVKVEDRGPVFFRQRRIGLDGTPFDCLKLRSMCVDAEARLVALQREGAGNEVMFKMKEDPRITRTGKFIRRYSIDELPQLWNILIGEMSLVGPRPALPREVEQYDLDARRRLRVRPGLTGLWQVSGRSSLSWADTVRLDLYYVDNWAFVQDLFILLRTAKAVVGKDGAY